MSGEGWVCRNVTQLDAFCAHMAKKLGLVKADIYPVVRRHQEKHGAAGTNPCMDTSNNDAHEQAARQRL